MNWHRPLCDAGHRPATIYTQGALQPTPFDVRYLGREHSVKRARFAAKGSTTLPEDSSRSSEAAAAKGCKDELLGAHLRHEKEEKASPWLWGGTVAAEAVG